MLAEARRACSTRSDIHIPNLRALVAQLSGGQRQSIAIGRAAAFEPQRPDHGRADLGAGGGRGRGRAAPDPPVARSGVAVILITHRLQDLFRVCDRIAVMYEGLKVAERRIGETDLEDLVA